MAGTDDNLTISMLRDSIPRFDAEELGTPDDMRLVLDSIAEASHLKSEGSNEGHLYLGHTPADDPETVFLDIFGCGCPLDVSLSVFSRHGSTDLTIWFDIGRLSVKLRPLVSSGISNDISIRKLVGPIPLSVSERIDAARADPRQAAHFIATAADHLADAIRLRLQDVLMPMVSDGDNLCWSASRSNSSQGLWPGLDVVLPFASRVAIKINSDYSKVSKNAE